MCNEEIFRRMALQLLLAADIPRNDQRLHCTAHFINVSPIYNVAQNKKGDTKINVQRHTKAVSCQ